MLIPASLILLTFFNQPEILEDKTRLCGLTKLRKKLSTLLPDLQPSVREIYSSNVLTTKRFGSCEYARYETIGGALPLHQLWCSL